MRDKNEVHRKQPLWEMLITHIIYLPKKRFRNDYKTSKEQL